VYEAITGFKGSFNLKQYMPRKPTQWGVKFCGHLLKCKIYRGKVKANDKEPLLREQVIVLVTEECTGKYHHINFNKFLFQ
jgi:hypothetical protein